MMCMAPLTRKDVAQRAKTRVRIAQMVKHAGANDLVECLAELRDPLDRKPVELQISYVVLLLKIAGVAQARFADVDRGHARVRLHERVPRGLRRSASSDKDRSVWPRLLQWPQQQRLRPAPARVPIAIEATLEAGDGRWIGMQLIERANRLRRDRPTFPRLHSLLASDALLALPRYWRGRTAAQERL